MNMDVDLSAAPMLDQLCCPLSFRPFTHLSRKVKETLSCRP